MDKSIYTYHRYKVFALLGLAFVFLFAAYLFSGAGFVLKYVSPNESYITALFMVISSSAFWFFFIVQLVVYSTVVVVILNTFYNERKITLMQQEFVNNVTHEIKTPLSTILMAAEVLVEDNIEKKPFRRDQYISIIRNEGEKLRADLDRVLDVSRASNVGLHLNKEFISPKEQILHVIERMSLQFTNYQGSCDVVWNAENLKINFDKKSFDLILINLLDNALKYNISEPKVIVQGNVVEGDLIIQIKDNGIGIDEVYHSELFQRFFRVPLGETHHIKGFGLGLYLVKQLMDAHKSAIFVSSNGTDGTTVTLKIPVVL